MVDQPLSFTNPFAGLENFNLMGSQIQSQQPPLRVQTMPPVLTDSRGAGGPRIQNHGGGGPPPGSMMSQLGGGGGSFSGFNPMGMMASQQLGIANQQLQNTMGGIPRILGGQQIEFQPPTSTTPGAPNTYGLFEQAGSSQFLRRDHSQITNMATQGSSLLAVNSSSFQPQNLLASGQEEKQNDAPCIKNVWIDNLEDELPIISELLEKYNYIAMDTEFPGVIIDEVKENFRDLSQREYLKIKANVDLMKVIQIGITLSDENGKMPEPISTWQFNFNFDIDNEEKALNSIQILKDSGIDFQKLKRRGIGPLYFAEKVTSSGLVLNDNLHWLCFHGSYDFAYLLKVMMNDPQLPPNRDAFFKFLGIFFPNVYDIKTFAHEFVPHFEGGLNRLADMLGVTRIGTNHQAGSDSLVTSKVFFKMKDKAPQFHSIVSTYNLEIYGFKNEQAHITVGTRVPTFQPPAISALGINEGIALGAANFEDSDSLTNENYFNYLDYDQSYPYGGINAGIGGSHSLDISYPVHPSRGGYPLHSYHNSQSMHHDQLSKNLQKIQNPNLDSFVAPSVGGNVRNGHLMQSTTPPPIILDNGQYSHHHFRGGAQQNSAHDLYHQNQWAGYYNQGSSSYPNNGYYQQ